jgi:hypothetical protein
MADEQGTPAPASRAVVVGGIAIYAIAGVLTAVFEVLLVPLRHGATLVPIAVPLAIATNVALPLLCRQLTRTPLAITPVVTWVITAFVLASSRPEGDVLLPAADGGVQWVGYAMLFGAPLAGLITIAVTSPPTRVATGRRPDGLSGPRVRPGSGNGGAR